VSRPTGLTRFGHGTSPLGNLGRVVGDADARATLHTAWEVGLRRFDTAPHYGLGLSERRLGAALREWPRAEYRVSTKVGRTIEPNPGPTGAACDEAGFVVGDAARRRFDFSADAIRRGLAESLDRLGLDHVDVVYLHDPDDYLDQAIAQAVPALHELKAEGVVGAIGAGMNHWRPLLRLVSEADLDTVMLAGRWSLLDRSGAPLLAACADRGVTVTVAAPFNSGLLARPWPPDGATYDYGPAGPQLLERARALAETCRRYDVELPAAAAAFPLRHPAVSEVVVGLRTAESVRDLARRAAVAIDESLWDELDVALRQS
jgi:D-threo-aldose 1-dehydrogenase